MPLSALLAAAVLSIQPPVATQPAPAAGPPSELQSPVIVDLYSPGVARISAEHNTHQGPARRTGAGFFMGPGRLVTSRSLLYGATSAHLTMDNGRTLPLTRVLGEDLAADLVIAAAEVPPDLLRGLALSPLPPIPGEEVAVIGAPVPAEPGKEDRPARHDLAVSIIGDRVEAGLVAFGWKPGAPAVPLTLAGAPALNVTGQAVAVVTRRPGEADSTIAVPATRIQEIVVTAGLPFDEWTRGTPLPRPASPDAPPPPASIEHRPDGSMLLDGRFIVTGKGTPEEPYKVSWDLLLSASEEYVPKQGRKNIPERVAMFASKQVEITGHIAFPIMAEEAHECLSMMNPWDGCCIGVPPTPYDAVEVHLGEPVVGQARFTTYGSITGNLRVEPQLVGNWLVGLYVIDGAKLTPKAFGGFAP